MDNPQRLYHQLDTRVRGLSRVSYAFFMGLISAVCILAVGLLLFEELLIWAVPVGIGMAVLYYVLDPNNEN